MFSDDIPFLAIVAARQCPASPDGAPIDIEPQRMNGASRPVADTYITCAVAFLRRKNMKFDKAFSLIRREVRPEHVRDKSAGAGDTNVGKVPIAPGQYFGSE